ncbi:MAG: radical SAM protein [Clostridia bacterium]|nr:radical SAM protein [Clostridia bacterium]
MTTDGEGVTTLVIFHDCPLRCKYCLNPFSFAPDTKREELTPNQLYDRVKIDDLYFVATGGGVTFGGGEPLLRADFLKEFRALCGDRWHLCAETSLNVPAEAVRTAAECMDMFYVDCKDTNPQIYKAYTGIQNAQMLENLRTLISLAGTERVVVRVPLIPGYNTEEDREKSRALLTSLGVTQFDFFTYKTERRTP